MFCNTLKASLCFWVNTVVASSNFIVSPVAMSTFGVVTNGVGTIHAPGGAAAILQYISTCGTIASSSAVLLPTAVLRFLYYNKDVIRAKIQAKL